MDDKEDGRRILKDGSEWSIETVEIFLTKISNERDRTYQQRWEASEKATVTALNAAKEAVAAALLAQKEAVTTAFTAQEKAVAAALTAAERAVSKAEVASEKRFDAINEFQSALTNQATTFLPRAEFDRTLRALGDKLDVLTQTLTDKTDAASRAFEARIESSTRALDAKSEANTLKIEANNKAFGARIDDLRTFKDATSGRTAGLNAGWVYLNGAVALFAIVLSIILTFRK